MDSGNVGRLSSYTEVFESACPYYMALGMSYSDFWFGDPSMVKPYRESYNFKRRMRNEELWLQGAYFRDAVASLLDKKAKYPKEPYDIYPKTAMEKQAEAEANRQKIIEHFTQLKRMWENKNGNNRQLNS